MAPNVAGRIGHRVRPCALLGPPRKPDCPDACRYREAAPTHATGRGNRSPTVRLIGSWPSHHPFYPQRRKLKKAVIPGYRAAPPRSSSILKSSLYLATRSPRDGAPVLICPAFVATAR